MSEKEKTRRDKAQALIEGFQYLEDVLTAHEQLPHDRVVDFCRRHEAPLGFNIWSFLINRAEELERQNKQLKEENEMMRKQW